MAAQPPSPDAAMPKVLRAALAFATLLLLAATAEAQALQWTVTPSSTNGYPMRIAADAYKSRHHLAALDGSGNLFISGYYYSVPSDPFPEVTGQFLGKYNADTGAEQWKFMGAVQSIFSAVAVNAAGDAF